VFVPHSLQPSVFKVIQNECHLNQATLHISTPTSPHSVATNDCFRVQQENLSVALAVCEHLKISHEGIATGFYWPCRMESFISTSHCEEAITDSRQAIKVIVDGCHNGASVDLFMTDLRQLYPPAQYELWVLVGMGKDKNVDSMLQTITSIADQLIFVKSRHFRALSMSPSPPFSLPLHSLFSLQVRRNCWRRSRSHFMRN
jgi:folylpolyglutamate synthase/dihydropteroate synthase